jgi:hypothetical protein
MPVRRWDALGVIDIGDRLLRRRPHDSRPQHPASEGPLLDTMHFGEAFLDILHPLF